MQNKKNISLFLGWQALSLFGSMLVQYSTMWYVIMSTQSGKMATIAVVVGLLPTFFIAPFGGVWADRYNRKNLINLADGGIALVTLFIALSFLFGYKEIWLLFVCTGVRAVGQGIQSPAVSSFIPQIVPQEQLNKINGINTSIQSFSALTAPMIAGALMSFIPLQYIFFIDIVTAIIGICILQFFVKIPANSRDVAGNAPVAKSYFRDLKEGIRYVWQTKWIRYIILLEIILHVFGHAPTAFLSPLQVTRNFGNDVWRLTAIEVAFSSGMLLGGLLIGFWGGFKNKMYSMSLACVIIGAGMLGLGLLPNFWLYCATWIVIGLIAPLSNVPCTTLLQTKTDPAYLGRGFSVFQMVFSLAMPLAMLVFGPLSDVINIDYMLIGGGIVIFLLSIPYVVSKVLREADRN
ncbi:MAG: MFS transporter [Bacteroidales bacterium]|jgi:DHA3 family macrolide efflux protein-like MFS transporter|nr:MFS transporter [Bacteroidales bacterium]